MRESILRSRVVKTRPQPLSSAVDRSASLMIGFAAFTLCALIAMLSVSRVARTELFRPQFVVEQPTQGEEGVDAAVHPVIRFNKRMRASTINSNSIQIRDESQRRVACDVAYDALNESAILTPRKPLRQGGTYVLEVKGNEAGGDKAPAEVQDLFGRTIASSYEVHFSIGTSEADPAATNVTSPILLITSRMNGFSQYYAEILRNEGFNEFSSIDVSDLNSSVLNGKSIILLGEVKPTPKQISGLAAWVHQGGELITMRPDPTVAVAFGGVPVARIPDDGTPSGGLQSSSSGTYPNRGAYLAIQPSSPAGAGLFHHPLQFHGPANPYTYRNATVLATLYNNYELSTNLPAVSAIKVGRGDVVIFNYDLAKSVVYTRQGNPDWSGEERDGVSPVRSDDLFYGHSASDPQPDWVDERNIAVPQADEQQRLLANIITLASQARTPLPHFWYLPNGFKAAVVMTGDDHGNGGTVKRFKHYLSQSAPGCSVENWECVRATSNIFVNSITPAQAGLLNREGFEIGLHVYTGCKDWPTSVVRQPNGVLTPQMDRAYAETLYHNQFATFAARYPGVPLPVSNRIDCVTWGDYDTQPQVELDHGVRFDTNYYYWPGKWVENRPGLFTGSGLPMRFARRDGSVVDVYQAATQMTDESGQNYPATFDSLLANALGDDQFFAVFTVNMHNDRPRSAAADSIIASSLAHRIPVVTAAQMLRWLDGRNASRFKILGQANHHLKLEISIGVGANGIQALLPINSTMGEVSSLTLNNVPISFSERTIAGITYAAFAGQPGTVDVTYAPANNAAIASATH